MFDTTTPTLIAKKSAQVADWIPIPLVPESGDAVDMAAFDEWLETVVEYFDNNRG